MKKLLLLALSSLFFFSNCKVVKYTSDKLPVQQIVFGDGGGFAGIETAYTLLENGQIFKKIGADGTYSELKSIKPKQAKTLFEKVNSLQLFKLDMEKPGNLYYFLQQATDQIDSRVTWGAGDYVPPQAVVSVYKELQAIVKTQAAATTAQKSGSKPGGTEGKEKKEKTEEPGKW